MDAALTDLAARQHGLLTRAQGWATGVPTRGIEHRLATGRWAPVARGVDRLAGVAVTWRQRALPPAWPVARARESPTVRPPPSGASPGSGPAPLEIIVPTGRSNRNTLARVHRSARVEAVRQDGVR